MGNEARFRAAEAALWASIEVAPTERRITLTSTGTTVRVQEVGDGPPILYIHGASNGGTSWATLAAVLPQFRHILIDRPGCGLSDPLPSPLTNARALETFADGFVANVLDALDLASANVVATSLGGYFGIRAAAAAPERIEKLMLIAFPAGAPMKQIPLIMRVAQLPALGRLTASIPPSRSMVKAILKQIGVKGALASGAFTPEMLAWFQSLLRDTNSMRNEIDSVPPLTTMRSANPAMLHSDATLGGVTAPTYVLWGTDDPMGGEAFARAFTDRLPNATLEMMMGAGHAPWMDDAEFVATRVASFFG